MKQILVMMAAVALVGCGKKASEQQANVPDTNPQAQPPVKQAKQPQAKQPETPKAVAAAKGVQCRFCEKIFPAANIRTHEFRCPKNATDQSLKPANHPAPNPKQPNTTAGKLIAEPLVEKEIRRALKKYEGELTK